MELKKNSVEIARHATRHATGDSPWRTARFTTRDPTRRIAWFHTGMPHH